ncbi:hypothetical protein [Prescottella equi]|uniref:hypothetical protein n=1 Tax=Rhodococcus hoagii TaxID=43767 RepID=UPI001F3D5741|nr:hypothetical protein [Prescottella equi]
MTAPTTRPPKTASDDGLWHWRRDVWRRDRTSMVPRATLVAALGAGVIATLILQTSVVSIAYLLTGAAVAVTAFANVRPRPTAFQLATVAGALALLAVAAVRGAEWLSRCVWWRAGWWDPLLWSGAGRGPGSRWHPSRSGSHRYGWSAGWSGAETG